MSRRINRLTFAKKLSVALAAGTLLLLLMAMLAVSPLAAQIPPPGVTITPRPKPTIERPTSEALSGVRYCIYRKTFLRNPWSLPELGCVEAVINEGKGGVLGYTALATAPDGTLYAARPLAGEIYALTDTNDDLLPDAPRLIAQGLTFPNGLDYVDGALYISGGPHVYRLRDGKLETLIDDLPSGDGFWTGGIAVGPDQRIYVSTGAPCDACKPDDPARGAILSFDLDGGDRELVATGLREPADLAFAGNTLWTVDTARDGLAAVGDLDELNRVSPGADFGFPYCIGADNRPDLGGSDCSKAVAPAQTFPTHSHPTGIAAYRGDAIPYLTNSLIVVLSGTVNLPTWRATQSWVSSSTSRAM